MPALSPTMTKGGVTSWLVSEGQKVSAGDVLAEIQTDKATMEMESMEDGFVAKILIEAGREDIDVGTPLLVMVEDEKDVASFKEYVGGKAEVMIAAVVLTIAVAKRRRREKRRRE